MPCSWFRECRCPLLSAGELFDSDKFRGRTWVKREQSVMSRVGLGFVLGLY